MLRRMSQTSLFLLVKVFQAARDPYREFWVYPRGTGPEDLQRGGTPPSSLDVRGAANPGISWPVKHNSTHGLPLQPHTPTTVHHFSSHTPKSTLHGGFNVQVTCLVSHTIRWISKDLTANTQTAQDLSHSDTAASQWGAFVLSRHSTVEQPGLQRLSEPPAVCIDDRISDISLPARESRK